MWSGPAGTGGCGGEIDDTCFGSPCSDMPVRCGHGLLIRDILFNVLCPRPSLIGRGCS
jgi:hypothetical protein